MKISLRMLACFTLCFMLVFSTFLFEAAEAKGVDKNDKYKIMESDLEGYEYVKYNEPIEENYDGGRSVLLGYLKPKDVPIDEILSKDKDFKTNGDNEVVKPMDYYEYDVYEVYDNGIIEPWSYLSNPYFIISIAKGMEYTEGEDIITTISASYSGSYPAAAKSAINNAFGFSSSGTKTVERYVKFSGPEPPYNSRDFYYQKGRHTHDVLITQEHRSNWDGLLWTKDYDAEIGVPAIKTYSVDTY